MNLCRTLPEVPFARFARPTDGFLDFGRLGLVLGPLIQGTLHAKNTAKVSQKNINVISTHYVALEINYVVLCCCISMLY